MTEISFRSRVYQIVSSIPRGKLMTYGQIAALCGKPRAARQVGQIAHFGPIDLPWHRVVNKNGGLARGWPGGIQIQKALLEDEDVEIDTSHQANVKDLLWWPE